MDLGTRARCRWCRADIVWDGHTWQPTAAHSHMPDRGTEAAPLPPGGDEPAGPSSSVGSEKVYWDRTGRMLQHPQGYGHIEWRVGPGGVVEIVDIEVEASHRGQGVGRRLLELLFYHLQETGLGERVYAITRAGNVGAQEFYERCRFAVCGNLRRFYQGEERTVDAVMYVRSIRGPV